MGKVGKVYDGNIDWDGETINDEDYSYYDDPIEVTCRNSGCDNAIRTTQYEYDENANDTFCLDCLMRHGPSEQDFSISVNTLEILNDPNGVHKCINNFKHNVSILSDSGCFECAIKNVKLLQTEQVSYNNKRNEKVTMGKPTLLDGILFRSKSESSLYNQLKKFDSEILYEMLYVKVKINNEIEYYNPDFYLPNLNLFIEYRGYNADTPEKNHQYKKTYALANKIRFGLRNHSSWHSEDEKDINFCKMILIAPFGVRYFQNGTSDKYFSYKVCSHCKNKTSLLDIFNKKCFFCGR